MDLPQARPHAPVRVRTAAGLVNDRPKAWLAARWPLLRRSEPAGEGFGAPSHSDNELAR